ncbi:MAG: hypothetical protein J1F36_00115 [Clostridiales bacterium]|nr:hypothetical protein [Clostridiales bacterium]
MKKSKKLIVIPVVIVAVIAVAVLVLSLIRVNPVMDNFGDFDRVNFLQSSDGNEYRSDIEDKLASWLKDTDFSIMQGILEGKFSYAPTLKKTTVDGEKENMTITAASVKAYGAIEGEYILKFYFSKVNGKYREITIDGTTIKYDRMLLRLYESNGEIKEMECVPYIEYNIDNQSIEDVEDENGHIGSQYYNANVLSIKMNTSKLLISLKEYLEING